MSGFLFLKLLPPQGRVSHPHTSAQPCLPVLRQGALKVLVLNKEPCFWHAPTLATLPPPAPGLASGSAPGSPAPESLN